MTDELEAWVEKCMTCKHVYKRKDDADTLYCRCRKGCRYEKVELRRSSEGLRGYKEGGE